MNSPLKFIPLVLLAGLLLSTTSFAQVIYDQPFTNNAGGERSISVVSGWATYAAADGAATTSVRVQTSRGGTLYVPSNATGYVIRGTDIDLALTAPATFAINTIQTGSQARFQFLIQIDDGNWYSSNTIFTPVTSSDWTAADNASLNYNKSLAFTTTSSDWSLFDMTGTGIATTALSSDLSGTNITGIGVWVRGSTVSRYDDLTVSSVPEPASFAALAGGLGLLAAFTIRRRRA